MPNHSVKQVDLQKCNQIIDSYLKDASVSERRLLSDLIIAISQNKHDVSLASLADPRNFIGSSFKTSDIEKIKAQPYDCLWVCLMMAFRTKNSKESLALLTIVESLDAEQIFETLNKIDLHGINLLMTGMIYDLDVGIRLLKAIATLKPWQQAHILLHPTADEVNILWVVFAQQRQALPQLLTTMSLLKLEEQADMLLYTGAVSGSSMITMCAHFFNLSNSGLFKFISTLKYSDQVKMCICLDSYGHNILSYAIVSLIPSEITVLCDFINTFSYEDRTQLFQQTSQLIIKKSDHFNDIDSIWEHLVLLAFKLDTVASLLELIDCQTPERKIELLLFSEAYRLAVILSVCQQPDPIDSLADIFLLLSNDDWVTMLQQIHGNELADGKVRFFVAMLAKIRQSSDKRYQQIYLNNALVIDTVLTNFADLHAEPANHPDDYDAMLEAIVIDGLNLVLASKELQSNLSLVLTAITQNPAAWGSASLELLSRADVAKAVLITEAEERIKACDAILKRSKRKSAYSMVKSKTKRDYPNAFDFFTRYRLKTVPVIEPVFTDEYSPEPKGEESYSIVTSMK